MMTREHLEECAECAQTFLEEWDSKCIGQGKVDWREMTEDDKRQIALSRFDQLAEDMGIVEWLKRMQTLN